MSGILIDTSVWIEYFAGNRGVDMVSDLIDNNLLCVNNLILAELIPFLRLKKEEKVISLLGEVENIPLSIDWKELVEFQTVNLKQGINNVGIPDLIIMQNVIHNKIELFSLDKHFSLMRRIFKFKLFNI